MQSEQSISKKIIRNTIFNTVGRFWSILVALLLTPYIIRHIGAERYGIWAIVGVLTGYFGLLDFGISTSFVKYISEYYTRKNYRSINQVVNTGFVFYSIFALLIFGVALFFINYLLGFFKIPQNLYNEAVFVFFLGIILFGFSSALSPINSIQGGLQRMDITNKMSMAISVPNIAGTVFFLEKGYGLPGLMVNNTIILALSSIFNFIIAFKILPNFKFNPFLCTKEMFTRLFTFGYKMEIAKISKTLTAQIDKTLIGLLMSIGFVTFYQLGSAIIGFVTSLFGLLVSALIPAFSEIVARGERKILITSYLRGTKYLTFIIAPVFFFLIISAYDIMTIWMGSGYGKASLIIQILAVGWMINLIAQVGASTCIAIDCPQLMATGSIIIVVLNFFLSIFLIKTFGFSGVAWGTTLALTIGTVYFMIMLHNRLDISLKKLIKITFPYFVICTIAACIVFGMDMIINQFNLNVTRVMILIVFFVRSLIFFSAYIVGVLRGKLFDKDDFDFFQQKLPFAHGLIKRLSLKNAGSYFDL